MSCPNPWVGKMTQPSSTPQPPPGISGKRVTLWVITGLVVIGVSLSYTLWTYNRLDAARAQSANAWRGAMESLAERYHAAELGMAESAAGSATSEEFNQQLKSAVDTFRTTSIVNEQVSAAERIEELIGSGEFPSRVRQALPRSARLQSELEHYNQQRRSELRLLDSPGGKILEVFLNFPDSQPFQLAPAK